MYTKKTPDPVFFDDKAEYGRWVQEGWHQSWSAKFRDEWQKFWDAEPEKFAGSGTYYSKQDVLIEMNKLRNDARFAQTRPIH